MRRISRAWTRVAKVAMRKINIAGDRATKNGIHGDDEGEGQAIGPFRTAFEALTSSHRARVRLVRPRGPFCLHLVCTGVG